MTILLIGEAITKEEVPELDEELDEELDKELDKELDDKELEDELDEELDEELELEAKLRREEVLKGSGLLVENIVVLRVLVAVVEVLIEVDIVV